MKRRGWVLAGVAGLLVIGCARPGSGPADGSTETIAPTAGPATVRPVAGASPCFDNARLAAGPSPAHPSRVVPTGDGPGDTFNRNQAANDAFRDRRPLPVEYRAAGQPCVDLVSVALAKLTDQKRYDVASVTAALRGVRLTAIAVRPPGRLDLGAGDGVVFAATPGVGCIFGHHGPSGTTVDFAGGVADGGCLVAAD